MNARDQDKNNALNMARAVLGLTENAGIEEIKRAYRHLALIHHPDKNPTDIGVATEQFKAIKAAYDVLMERAETAINNTEEAKVKFDFTFFMPEPNRSSSASQASMKWSVVRDNGGSLDLTHPDIAHCCSSRLIISNINSSNPSISLPMKDCRHFYDAMMEQLLPVLRDWRHWKSSPSDIVEQMLSFQRPQDNVILPAVLGIVYSGYGIQADLQKIINTRFGFDFPAVRFNDAHAQTVRPMK